MIMKKMKVKLPLVALFFSLFLVQSALGQENKHFLVVDDQSPVDDVLIINDIESQFESEYGDIFVSKLNSEVTRSLLENKLTVFIYRSQALLIVGSNSPSDHVTLSSKVSEYLKDKKGIQAISKISHEIQHDDLTMELGGTCTNECNYKDEKSCGTPHHLYGESVLTCGNFDYDDCLEWQLTYCGKDSQCVDGECVTQIKCINECEYKTEKSCGTPHHLYGHSVWECGNFDMDECLEWKVKYCGDNHVCVDGQCVSEIQCINECEYRGERSCSTPHHLYGQSLWICGNFDSDSCLEWQVTYCGEGSECIDGECTQSSCIDDCEYRGERTCGTPHHLYGHSTWECGNFDSDNCLEWKVNWCPGDSRCVDGKCVEETCTNDCRYKGEKSCGTPHHLYGGSVLTCGNFDDDDCLDWQLTYCGSDQECIDGECVTQVRCTNECKYRNERKCGTPHHLYGESVLTCGDFDKDDCLEWQLTYCGEDSECVDGKCTLVQECSGCLWENKCYPYGIRIESGGSKLYCSLSNDFTRQKELGKDCENDFECLSNSCQNSKCVDLEKEIRETKNLLERIIEFLKSIFPNF
jgi:hypothetical protein